MAISYWSAIFGITTFLVEFNVGIGTNESYKDEQHEWLVRQRQEVPYLNDPAELQTLKLVQVLFRHGSRTPILQIPNDPNKDHDYGVKGVGHLLKRGQKQGFELGKYLRVRYDKYFSTNYSYDEVLAQASDIDRTIMTAEMCLAGLFPPGAEGHKGQSKPCGLGYPHYNPIPLRTIPRSIDNRIANTYFCAKKDKLYKEILQTPEIVKIFKNAEWTQKYLSEKTGFQNIDYEKMVYITDAFNVQIINRLKLPKWAVKVYPEKLSEIFKSFFTVNTTTPELSRIYVGPLLAEFIQNMELTIAGSPSRSWTQEDLQFYHFRPTKSYFFAGHDNTISSVLNAFGLYDNEQPAFTSALLLELHGSKNTTAEEDYTLKFFYKKQRGQPIRELELPKCPSPCSLPNFKKKYANLIVGNGKWQKECQV